MDTIINSRVAGADLAAVHCGPHAPAGQLLHIGYPGGIQFLAVGLLERAGDGVVGVALRQGGQLQKLRLAAVVGMDGGDVKNEEQDNDEEIVVW